MLLFFFLLVTLVKVVNIMYCLEKIALNFIYLFYCLFNFISFQSGFYYFLSSDNLDFVALFVVLWGVGWPYLISFLFLGVDVYQDALPSSNCFCCTLHILLCFLSIFSGLKIFVFFFSWFLLWPIGFQEHVVWSPHTGEFYIFFP